MADFTWSTALVFATENDLNGGVATGKGNVFTEDNFTPFVRVLQGNLGYISSGFTVTSSGLTATITGGYAAISGYLINATASLGSITLTASATNYIFLKLLFTSGKASSCAVE